MGYVKTFSVYITRQSLMEVLRRNIKVLKVAYINLSNQSQYEKDNKIE